MSRKVEQTLLDLKRPKSRFARSINVERDSGTAAIDGYLPVGRAIESIDRLARAMVNESTEVALSITGPYGSGKSSLALVVDSLFGPKGDKARLSAEAMLLAAAPKTLDLVHDALKHAHAFESGFIRAVVTAQREPIGHTVIRALRHGAERFTPPAGAKASFRHALNALKEVEDALDGTGARLDARTIRGLVSDISRAGPILLLVDEFGKNLEAFAESPGDGDLFLLQDLAEWTRNGSGPRLALVTLQHMAFGDYADGASAVQRREWVKIQGRFEDIPFVDTPGQTLALVAASFETPSSKLGNPLAHWAGEHSKALRKLGLTELAADQELLQSCWPLHPLSLAVLPDLCQRYGQNERTMFSFLAGNEQRGVVSFMRDTVLPRGGQLPAVHLDRLYDYFLEAAASMVSVSADASRWLEIDTRIRDARGQDQAAQRVLRCVGLLNLVSAGGSLRASRPMVVYGAVDGREGTASPKEVGRALSRLEAAGLITYREFADEYRVWQGSDFDLKSAISFARRRLQDESPRETLQRVLPLGPLVAARHSHTSGTLRAFERAWVDETVEEVLPLTSRDRGDGLVLYVVEGSAPTRATKILVSEKPVVFATTSDPAPLLEAARELAAIDEVLNSGEEIRSDWVVRKELTERRTAAAAALQAEFELAFGATSSGARWHWCRPDRAESSGKRWQSSSKRSPSVVVSDVADAYYASAVSVHNDLINRHELSSQAAKARREVVEVMATNERLPELGIEGFGPDRTLYLSTLDAFGLHGSQGEGFGYRSPSHDSPVYHLWGALVGQIRTATRARRNVADLYDEFSTPPYGLRAGLAPILLVAALRVHQDEFALYEHGTFRPTFGPDVGERLLRNPNNFEVKCFASGRGRRRDFLELLSRRFRKLTGSSAHPSPSVSLVAVVSALVARINTLPEFAKKTTSVSSEAIAVRSALLNATEPDVLIFEELPRLLGKKSLHPTSRVDRQDLAAMADAVASVMKELADAYPLLVGQIRTAVVRELRTPSDSGYMQSLQRRATEIADKVIDPRVKSLVAALRAEIPQEVPWLEYVGMQITGVPPQAWSDEDRRRFIALMRDAGGTFRRVEALNADMRSQDGDFDAVRFQVTWSRGKEAVKIVEWDDHRRNLVADIAEGAVRALEDAAGSRANAMEWLMAALAEAELQESPPDDVGATPYSARTKRKVELA